MDQGHVTSPHSPGPQIPLPIGDHRHPSHMGRSASGPQFRRGRTGRNFRGGPQTATPTAPPPMIAANPARSAASRFGACVTMADHQVWSTGGGVSDGGDALHSFAPEARARVQPKPQSRASESPTQSHGHDASPQRLPPSVPGWPLQAPGGRYGYQLFFSMSARHSDNSGTFRPRAHVRRHASTVDPAPSDCQMAITSQPGWFFSGIVTPTIRFLQITVVARPLSQRPLVSGPALVSHGYADERGISHAAEQSAYPTPSVPIRVQFVHRRFTWNTKVALTT